ncbi:DUF4260 domain-containing protein [Aestuariivirga sp.]|uniref:DUF4260 domain-containing protein n=1 Tax=Aestuariivirga sp. TaxID=2650926 RepID=UPI0039E38660
MMATGGVRATLRAEGAALFLAALIGFHAMGNVSWWMFSILFLAPDLSFLGYLLGPRVGSVVYNICHSTILPLLIGIAGYVLDDFILRDILWATALIWLAHIGFDRMLGYGLKYASGFNDTHLGRIGRN